MLHILEKEKKAPNALDLFRTPKMRKQMIISTLAWVIISVVYDGHVRSLENLPYNIFITNTIGGCLELPADLILLVTMDQLGRRWTFTLSLLVAGLAGIAAGCIPRG